MDNELAKIIFDFILQYNNELFKLYALCIMSNHGHILFDTASIDNPKPLGQIIQLIKGNTSRVINQRINRTGSFWQKASYDRLVRDEIELENIYYYIINNPVKAELVDEWQDWAYTYSL